jgi:hypothetical protein
MRYLGEDDVTQMMGIGYAGEVRQGPDGNLYQWVQGVDGLGNPIGFWSLVRRARRFAQRRLRPLLRRALPLAQRVVSAIPLPQAQAVAAGLRTATPLLRRAGIAGHNGLGALYQAPDGTVYQVEGLAEEEELSGLGEEELTRVMGIGYTGEVRQGPDGNLYQWVETVDGLGNPIGFWSLVRRARRFARRRLRPLLRRALPLAQRVVSAIPLPQAQAVAAGLRTATPLLRRAGIAGHNGLGALYQAPDGTVYQVEGLAEEEELSGLAQDEELEGFAQDEELEGLAQDEEIEGLAEEEELSGLAQDEELEGFAQDEELEGLDQGYVREPGTSGLEAYVPNQPASTRWFTPPAQPPEMWKPLW